MECPGGVCGCRVCGKAEMFPFTCKYCGGIYCSKHRLPEQHNCPNALGKPNYLHKRYQRSDKRTGNEAPSGIEYYLG